LNAGNEIFIRTVQLTSPTAISGLPLVIYSSTGRVRIGVLTKKLYTHLTLICSPLGRKSGLGGYILSNLSYPSIILGILSVSKDKLSCVSIRYLMYNKEALFLIARSVNGRPGGSEPSNPRSSRGWAAIRFTFIPYRTICMNNNIFRKYIFGSTSAITTSLALIIGLHTVPNAKMNMIGSLLVIAIADNISDSLGIHMYRETETISRKEVWVSTFSNLLARFFVSAIFILCISFLPVSIAVPTAVICGLLLLTVSSYFIAKMKNRNPVGAVGEHVAITIAVMIISKYLVEIIHGLF